jgi:hypothetical protein
MRYLEAACLIVVTAAFVYLLGEGGLAVRDFRIHTVPQVTQAATDLDRSAIILGATATNIEKGTRVWQAKQNALADQALSATKALNSDLQALNTLESQGTSLLASQTKSLPSLETTIGASVTDTAQQFASLAKQAQPVMENLQVAAKNVSGATASLNQAIVETSPEVLATTKQLNETSAQLAVTAKDGREVADAYKEKLLHPVKSFWHGVKAVFDLTVEALEAHAYWP